MGERNQAWLAIATQLCLVVGLSPLIAIVWKSEVAVSFLMGGLVCVLPNLYLYRRVFSHFGARAAKQTVRALYVGEAVKFGLTILGFLLVIFISWVKPLWIFIGYIVAQLGFWVTPIMLSVIQVNKRK